MFTINPSHRVEKNDGDVPYWRQKKMTLPQVVIGASGPSTPATDRLAVFSWYNLNEQPVPFPVQLRILKNKPLEIGDVIEQCLYVHSVLLHGSWSRSANLLADRTECTFFFWQREIIFPDQLPSQNKGELIRENNFGGPVYPQILRKSPFFPWCRFRPGSRLSGPGRLYRV
jgi:hypothetical protein